MSCNLPTLNHFMEDKADSIESQICISRLHKCFTESVQLIKQDVVIEMIVKIFVKRKMKARGVTFPKHIGIMDKIIQTRTDKAHFLKLLVV